MLHMSPNNVILRVVESGEDGRREEQHCSYISTL